MNGNQNKANGQKANEPQLVEAIKATTRNVFMAFQIVQTSGLLFCLFVIKYGQDNWLGNLFPDPGTFGAIAVFFLFFVMMWVKNIDQLAPKSK